MVRRSQTAARLVLQVSMIAQGAAMDIEADLVEPVDALPQEAHVVTGATSVLETADASAAWVAGQLLGEPGSRPAV